MTVVSLFPCIFVVFLLLYITSQCTDKTSPISSKENIDSVVAAGWRYIHCAIAAFTVQNCGNVNVTTIDAAQNFNDTGLKVWCLMVISVVAIWKITTTFKKPTTGSKNIVLDKKIKMAAKINYLHGILDAIGVGVISTDSQMKITFINSTARNMCAVNSKLAKGKFIGDVVQVRDKNNDFTACNIHKSFEENCPISEDTALELHNHHGRYVEVQQKISPLLLEGIKVGAVILLLDVSASRNVIRKLSYNASHDSLTGLPNRASFEECLRNAAINSEKWDLQHAIVFVDLDGFKMINDGAGHAAGDELLKQIAQLMQSQLRHSDFVARLGGDEFGLILFNCELTRAKILMSKLVSSIYEYSFCWEGEVKHVGASAGITNVDSRKKSVSVLLAEADAACYAAKRRGKGQVCVFAAC